MWDENKYFQKLDHVANWESVFRACRLNKQKRNTQFQKHLLRHIGKALVGPMHGKLREKDKKASKHTQHRIQLNIERNGQHRSGEKTLYFVSHVCRELNAYHIRENRKLYTIESFRPPNFIHMQRLPCHTLHTKWAMSFRFDVFNVNIYRNELARSPQDIRTIYLQFNGFTYDKDDDFECFK